MKTGSSFSFGPKNPAAAPAATKTAPAPKPKSGAAPGTKDAKAAKEKIKRVDYPLPVKEGSEDGEHELLTTIPADYNPKKHKPLTRKMFKEEHVFFELRAQELEKKAAKMRQLAEDSKKLGSVADRVKAKRLQAMARKMEELKAQLSAQGIDPEALLAAASKDAAEATA